MKPPTSPAGKTARAICETTESVELGSAWTCTARYETPRNSVIAIAPSTRERRGRVLSVRPAERVDAVRDRLHAGERGRARRERAQQDEERDRAGARPAAGSAYDRLRAMPRSTSSTSPTPTSTTIAVTNT